jgi:cell division protein ZapE
MSGPKAAYRRRVESGELSADPAQERAAAALERLYRDLVRAAGAERGLWQRLLARKSSVTGPARGVYLWGNVGRGKTFLMDLFFESLPFAEKRRRHFHRFMAETHDALKRLADREDPLRTVAEELAAETRVLCFDELAVTDIADAMILGRLFAAMFDRGVTLAATSNIAPDELYRNGLQRQRFLPTIALLKRHMEIVHVDGAIDYRLRVLERADVFQIPGGAVADERLNEYFEAIAPDEGDRGGVLELFGRPIDYRRAADGVIWFDFRALCSGPRSQDDYIELSRLYQTVLVSDVPRFERTRDDEARRFIALVDEFYDRRVKLIVSAAARPAELYAGERLRHEFQRTASRLEEMQSREYFASAHRA